MSEIVGSKGQVYGVEIVKDLYNNSKKALRNYNNIKVSCQDGREGLIDKAPFDRILISAALEQIPFSILKQLKNNGIIVAPVGTFEQSIVAFRRHGDVFAKIKEIPGFVFVRFV
jgi:protein-L-isoaspartate(D-aspartate) O-methyltransferase